MTKSPGSYRRMASVFFDNPNRLQVHYFQNPAVSGHGTSINLEPQTHERRTTIIILIHFIICGRS